MPQPFVLALRDALSAGEFDNENALRAFVQLVEHFQSRPQQDQDQGDIASRVFLLRRSTEDKEPEMVGLPIKIFLQILNEIWVTRESGAKEELRWAEAIASMPGFHPIPVQHEVLLPQRPRRSYYIGIGRNDDPGLEYKP